MRKRKQIESRSAQSKRTQSLQSIYAKSRRDFSAADLQKFTTVEKGIPLEAVIARMEAIQKGLPGKKA